MGNLLGEPFKEYVDNQIEVRQEVHGKANRTLEELQYLNSKNAWIKLASGTSFDKDRLALLSSPSIGINNPLLTGVAPGLDLAIQNVLFNGLTSFGGLNKKKIAEANKIFKEHGGNFDITGGNIAAFTQGKHSGYFNFSQTQRAGIGGANGAYGVGGTQQHGYSPMPGITDADIKDLNRGSIKKATINLKVHNRNQFDVIDALYLRLGFTVMLEWGVDKYLSTNTIGGGYTLENMGTTLIDKKFWTYSNSSYNDILPEIEKMREKYQGNYDGMFGVISNFSWTFEADGSYNIKLEIMSQGDVIESLKANLPKKDKGDKVVNEYDKLALARAKETEITDRDSFFALYPGLEKIIRDWHLITKSTNATDGYTSATYTIIYGKYGGIRPSDSLFSSNYPSLNVDSYESDKTTFPDIKNDVNIDQAKYLDKVMSKVIEKAIKKLGKEQDDIDRLTFSSKDYLGEEEDLSILNDPSLKGGKKLNNTKLHSFDKPVTISGTLYAPYERYSLEASFRKFEKNNRVVKDGITSAQKDGVARMWVGQNLTLDNILNEVFKIYQDKNYAGGPDDEQFQKERDEFEKLSEEKKEKKTVEEELLEKKDKNKINNYLYRVRNVWEGLSNGKYKYVGEKEFGWIEFGSKDSLKKIGVIHNPIGETEGSFKPIWNKEVNFPIYPRYINIKSQESNFKSLYGNSMGDTGSTQPNFTDFIKLNITPIISQHFIRLGVFLEFLERFVVPKIKTGSKIGQPMLLIDFHPENNICYTIDNILPLNLKKTLINNQTFFNGKEFEIIFKSAKKFKRQLPSGGPIWGNIMNIYFNFARLEELFDSVDEKNEVSIYEILKSIATDINESLGNVNNIEPIIDKETNTIKFIDQTSIPGLEAIANYLNIDLKKSTTVLEIFGNNPINNTSNFIRSAGITTEISKEYATMITIGATANGAIPGAEATAFSKWNIGISDRFKTQIVDGESEGEETLEDQNKAVLQSYLNMVERETSKLGLNKDEKGGYIIDDDLISTNKDSASNYYIYAQAETSLASPDSIESSIGFLPFNLKLSMDGLSGIKIYSRVNVNTSFLPSNYGETLSFIITGVNHKLSNNEWVTSLDTIATTKEKKESNNSNTEKSTEVEKDPTPSQPKLTTSNRQYGK